MGEAERFLVRLTCCGRDAGTYGPGSWADADTFRESYLAGTVAWNTPAHEAGHRRSAIIVTVRPVGGE